jgi:hypothetical protein
LAGKIGGKKWREKIGGKMLVSQQPLKPGKSADLESLFVISNNFF